MPASHPEPPRASPWPAFEIAAVYAALTFLVWGLLALDRGLFQDDVQILFRVFSADGRLARWTTPIAHSTRIFTAVPFTLALATGAPRLALQLLFGLLWLAIGYASHGLARALFPGRPWLAYLAGATTLCATSDFLTDSPVALGYQASILAYLAAALCLARWLEEATWGWLAGAGLLVAASVWTTDAVLASILLTPALLGLVPEDRGRVPDGRGRRLALACGVWYAVLVPYLAVLGRSLRDPGGYIAGAILRMSWPERGARLATLFRYNFAPWDWVFARRLWFPAPPPLLLAGQRAGLALAAAALFAAVGLRLWRARPEPVAPFLREGRRSAAVVLLCLLLALAANAVLASVKFSQFFYRTHLLSRIWVSLAVAAASYALGVFALRRPALALAVPALFVGLGTWAGLERQDYYLGYTHRHRAELGSILAAAPGLGPQARLLLRVPPPPPPFYYLATDAPYLARAWASLLYGDPSLELRVFLASAQRGTACRPDGDALLCTGEGSRVERLPYASLVVLTYRPEENRYALERTLPADLAPVPPAAGAYRPEAQILPRPASALARDLLGG